MGIDQRGDHRVGPVGGKHNLQPEFLYPLVSSYLAYRRPRPLFGKECPRPVREVGTMAVITDLAGTGVEQGRPHPVQVGGGHEYYQLGPSRRRTLQGHDSLESGQPGHTIRKTACGRIQVGVSRYHRHALTDGQLNQPAGGGRVAYGQQWLKDEGMMGEDEAAASRLCLLHDLFVHIEGNQDAMDFNVQTAGLQAHIIPFLRQAGWGELLQD